MHEILLMAAKFLPQEAIFDKLKDAVSEYSITKDKEKKNEVLSMCMLFLASEKMKETDIMEALKEMKEVESIHNQLHKNKS